MARTKRRYTSAEYAKMKEKAQAMAAGGAMAPSIASLLGVSISAVRSWIPRRVFYRNKNSEYREVAPDAIMALYKQNWSLIETAAALGADHATVRNALEEAGFKIKRGRPSGRTAVEDVRPGFTGMFNAGMTYSRIGDRFGITPQGVHAIVKHHKLERPKRKTLGDKLTKAIMRDGIPRGVSVVMVAERYDVSRTTAAAALVKAGIDVRSMGRAHKRGLDPAVDINKMAPDQVMRYLARDWSLSRSTLAKYYKCNIHNTYNLIRYWGMDDLYRELMARQRKEMADWVSDRDAKTRWRLA